MELTSPPVASKLSTLYSNLQYLEYQFVWQSLQYSAKNGSSDICRIYELNGAVYLVIQIASTTFSHNIFPFLFLYKIFLAAPNFF